MLKKIINTCLLTCIVLLFSFYHIKESFKTNQLKSPKVRTAYLKKWPALQQQLKAIHVDENNFDVYLSAFKYEGLLELYVKNVSDQRYQLLKSIAICAKSGSLGPKRKQGDLQVPEGFYEISSFNPYSNYHLALQIGYPNKSDLIKSKGNDPGGDIMIHGNCVTIGCIPLENDPVEEVYLLCLEAKNRGRIIRSDIYPFKFSDKNNAALEENVDAETKRFWNSLKKGYAYFELNHSLPKITTDKKGNYLINPL